MNSLVDFILRGAGILQHHSLKPRKVQDKPVRRRPSNGYIDEYDISRFYRDLKVVEIYEGSKEVEKLIISIVHIQKILRWKPFIRQ